MDGGRGLSGNHEAEAARRVDVPRRRRQGEPGRWAVEAVDRLRRSCSLGYESDDVGVADEETRGERAELMVSEGRRISSVRTTFGTPGGGSACDSRTPPGVCPVPHSGMLV